MPNAPATENQLRAEQAIEKLFRDGDIGSVVRNKLKGMFPDITVPDDYVAPAVDSAVKPLKEENEALKKRVDELSTWQANREKKDSEADVFSKMQAAVNKAVGEYSLTEEGKAKMLDRMKETGNLFDADAAAAWVASKTPPKPVDGPTWMDKSMNLFGTAEKDESFALLHKNPDRYTDAEISKFLKDPNGYVQETFGAAA